MKNHFKLLMLALAITGLITSCGDGAKPETTDSTEAKNETATLVTVDNFVVAESDNYFNNLMKEVPINTFNHHREYANIETQVIIRENQDCLYSHALVDVSEGATLKNPEWDKYSIIQVLDENQYTIAVIYPGEEKTLTPDDLTMGNYIWLNTRTEVRPENEAGYADAHKHQDA